jgi:S1-C subfamily serine protease
VSEPQQGDGSPTGEQAQPQPTQPLPPTPPAPPISPTSPVQQPAAPGAVPWAAAPPQPGPQEQWSYSYAPPPGWTPYAVPAPPPPRRRHLPVATVAVVAVIAAGAGVTIGHAVWHTASSATASTASGENNGTGTTGGSGTGSGSGTNPFGSSNGNGTGGGAGSGTGGSNGFGGSGGTNTGTGSTTEGSGGPSDVSAIAQKVDPALVDINSTFSYQSAEGAGTGIVLTSNGEILTNNHVINGATSISVTDVGNGKTYTATVVGYDDSQDIAVLQLQGASGLTTANIGDSANAAVGQAVVAIGNAGGTGGTPSSAGGSVTALSQSISASDELDGTSEKLSGLIEVNADVQSGDSGGSLVNASGQVIGMDTAASESYSLQSQDGGQGYAIPINTATSIAKQIEASQSSSTVHVGETAFLGVMVDASSSSSSESGQGGENGFGSTGGTGSTSTVSGAEISEVVPNGAAATAGLTGGDVITSLDGQTVTSAANLTTIVGTLKVGQSVSIGYTDTSGQTQTGTVVLASGPPA